jgi:hypothetical protein
MFLERTILEKPIMTTLTISISDEEMHRLEELSKREGLTVEQMVAWASMTLSASQMTRSVPLPSV